VTRAVYWSWAALDDLKTQIAFINHENLDAARRVAAKIRQAGTQLGQHPTGRPGRVSSTYEKSISGLPYILAYELRQITDSQAVVILRVIHSARDWPTGKWPG
jgi:toxin ParE1/3/4